MPAPSAPSCARGNPSLGSAETISTSSGQSFEQRFDPFGAPDPSNATITRAGYTGHAHDNDLGLIDMKGRVYDPLAARFTTADPIMQAPHWSQGMNRYAYVFNDPINATDPSGFISMSDVVKGFVYGGHIASAGLFAVGSATNGSAATTNFAAVGGPAGGSSVTTMPGLLQGQPGSGPTVVDTPLTIPQPPSLCSSGQCVAQSAGDPSTGAHGQGNLSADIPAQPTAGEVADIVTSVYPGGRGAKAGAKQVVKARWFERAWKWAKGLFASESAAARGTAFATKQAAREALDGPLGSAANRFFRGAARNAQDFRITDLAEGGKRFEFFSPARNAGYGKLYVQEVDKAGSVIREFKNTMGPGGLIETKWLHGGP